MEPSKTLVVYYSRSGHTRRLAEVIAQASGGDLEELVDLTNRLGIWGYLRSGFDATFKRNTRLETLRRDPALYDLVIMGTPVWNESVSAPMRTFLMQNYLKFQKVAFFVTYGGRGAERVFKQMAQLSGQTPLAQLAVPDREFAFDIYAARAKSFVHFLVPHQPEGSPERGVSPKAEGHIAHV